MAVYTSSRPLYWWETPQTSGSRIQNTIEEAVLAKLLGSDYGLIYRDMPLLARAAIHKVNIPKDIEELIIHKALGTEKAYLANKMTNQLVDKLFTSEGVGELDNLIKAITNRISNRPANASYAIPPVKHLTPVGVNPNINKLLPIDFNQFRSDMETKWRYQHGAPEVREALMRSQAGYYDTLSSVGIPSEAALRLITAKLGIPSEALLRSAQAMQHMATVSQLIPAQAEQYTATARIGIPAQADYHRGAAEQARAMAAIGIPSTAAQNYATANYYNTLASTLSIDPILMAGLMSAVNIL